MPKTRNIERANHPTKRSDTEILNTTDVKRRLAEVALDVRRSRAPADMGPTSSHARYRLSPPDALPDDIREAAVHVGVDEGRRHFSAIRSLLETEDDIAFGIEVDGEMIAILHRHPDYNTGTAVRYRETWRAQRVLQRGGDQNIVQRNAELKSALEQVVAALGRRTK